jgi:hypothetical protein
MIANLPLGPRAWVGEAYSAYWFRCASSGGVGESSAPPVAAGKTLHSSAQLGQGEDFGAS